MKTIGIIALLVAVIASVGCSTTPLTVSPFATYGGDEGTDNQYWQVGVGFSFVLGKEGAVVPGPNVPAAPSRVNVNVAPAPPSGKSAGSVTNNNTTNNTTNNNTTNDTTDNSTDNSHDHIHNNQ